MNPFEHDFHVSGIPREVSYVLILQERYIIVLERLLIMNFQLLISFYVGTHDRLIMGCSLNIYSAVLKGGAVEPVEPSL
jgi:hypothetical protein